jgi:hypothetical protein
MMTEPAWLRCRNPSRMLDFLLCRPFTNLAEFEKLQEIVGGKATKRKLRLYACACCRRLLPHFDDALRHERAIETAEAVADGLRSDSYRIAARRTMTMALRGEAYRRSRRHILDNPKAFPCLAIHATVSKSASHSAWAAARTSAAAIEFTPRRKDERKGARSEAAEFRVQCSILRDIFQSVSGAEISPDQLSRSVPRGISLSRTDAARRHAGSGSSRRSRRRPGRVRIDR